MIKVRELYKKFGKQVVLKNLNLEINKPAIYAILGPNGSGKTTLIKSMLGMVIPDKGSIEFFDQKIKNQWSYRNKINYLPQIANFPGNLSVKELVAMISDIRSKSQDDENLIKIFGLHQFLNKKLVNLSGGTKQKVNLLLTFMFDNPIYILDEPTSGLDPVALLNLKKLISDKKERGNTIIITSHILQFVEEMADVIIYLLEGRIYFKGSIDELKIQTGEDTLEKAIAHLSMEKSHV